MTTDIAISFTNAIDYSDKRVLDTIKATLAPEATPAEFAMFIEFCKGTGLNPFKKEAWFIKTRGYNNKFGKWVEGRVQMMAGINGFYAIANSHPEYDGMEETVIERGPNNSILRATAKVWRKDRKFPSVGVAEWGEYFPGSSDKKNTIWETKPSVMIAKVAESIALRKAFPQQLNGLFTEEEKPPYADAEVLPKVNTAPPEGIEDKTDSGQVVRSRREVRISDIEQAVSEAEQGVHELDSDPWEHLLESEKAKDRGKSLNDLGTDWVIDAAGDIKKFMKLTPTDRIMVLAAKQDAEIDPIPRLPKYE